MKPASSCTITKPTPPMSSITRPAVDKAPLYCIAWSQCFTTRCYSKRPFVTPCWHCEAHSFRFCDAIDRKYLGRVHPQIRRGTLIYSYAQRELMALQWVNYHLESRQKYATYPAWYARNATKLLCQKIRCHENVQSTPRCLWPSTWQLFDCNYSFGDWVFRSK